MKRIAVFLLSSMLAIQLVLAADANNVESGVENVEFTYFADGLCNEIDRGGPVTLYHGTSMNFLNSTTQD